MNRKLNLTRLKKEQSAIESDELKSVRGGLPRCWTCGTICDEIFMYSDEYEGLYGPVKPTDPPGELPCTCSSIFVHFGLLW